MFCFNYFLFLLLNNKMFQIKKRGRVAFTATGSLVAVVLSFEENSENRKLDGKVR